MANVQALAEKNNKLFHPEVFFSLFLSLFSKPKTYFFFSKKCFAATFAELCHKCNKPMSDGYVPYKGHNYHPDVLSFFFLLLLFVFLFLY